MTAIKKRTLRVNGAVEEAVLQSGVAQQQT